VRDRKQSRLVIYKILVGLYLRGSRIVSNLFLKTIFEFKKKIIGSELQRFWPVYFIDCITIMQNKHFVLANMLPKLFDHIVRYIIIAYL